MAVDAEAKKLLGNLWADTGDREDPEDVGIARATGWPVSYEQIGSGSEPERTVFNQRFRELDGWASDRIRMGIPQWDIEVDYLHPAFVTTSSGLHVTRSGNTGPTYGNATDPDADAQTVWRRY